MRSLLVLLCSFAGVSFASDTQLVVLESLRFSAFESYTLVVSASPTDGASAEQTQLRIKGIVSRPAQEMKLEAEQQYANLDQLKAKVQTDYCKAEYVPAGESEFNAGSNITASLGDYVPAQLRIEISYHISSSSSASSITRKTSIVCPNSMRE